MEIGDTVEIQYPPNDAWNGVQFRITGKPTLTYFEGVVTKTNIHQMVKYPVGCTFTWATTKGLSVVDGEYWRQGSLFV